MERTPKFKVGHAEFNTLEEAQTSELSALIGAMPVEQIAAHLVKYRERFLTILKSTGRKPRVAKSRPVKSAAKPNSNREMLKAKTQFKPQEPSV